MSEAFLKVVNMSISAGWLVLAVFALRLILKKAPKWVNVLLWGIVAIRLICPFSIESALSLIPSTETISPDIMMDWTPEISTGIEQLDQVVNPVISTSFAPNPGTRANPLQILIPVVANLWLLGVLILLAYTAISYMTLRRKLRTAVILRDNIFQCETVSSPFVLGILKPKIYLPYSMDGNNLNHVVAHEQAHIKRKDHWWKPLGFLLLTVYWFNPLMWLAYILLCRDIELACDEKVIAELGNEQRADYTQALVACAVNRRMIAACPLAFGEVGVKDRVKSILNYRKPTFWIIVTALVVCVVVAVCFLTDPFEPVFNDVLHQNGYVILSQNDRELTLTVPKDYLPNEIYTAEGYEFDEGQVVVYSTDTTTVWLRKVMISNESPDQLYFAFDISYDIAEKGTILSINSRLPNDQYTIRGGLRSKDLRDDHTVYPGAVNMRGHGPDSQFWFYVSTDACKQAEGNLYFEVILNEIEYEADQRDRSISMSGDNVSDLNTEAIVERILDIENITNSGVYMNSMNFSLQVDSDFNWADSQAVTYFFTKAQTTYKGQLRIFPDEEKYFLTEPSEGQEQQSIYLLRHYLDAIKYLPQDAIRQMAQADQYIIQHREEGTPNDYDRVITYSSQGIVEIDCWNIHLQIQPLHEDGEAYSGTGEEVIDVFYSGNYSSASEILDGILINHPYGVVQVTYESPHYNFSMVAQENTPEYFVDENLHLHSVKEHSEYPDWTDLGVLTEISLTKDNFDDLFSSNSGDGWHIRESASAIRKNTKKAWTVIYNQDVLYYILQQKNGELYLAYGYYDYSEKDDPGSDDTNLRWLYLLARKETDKPSLSLNDIIILSQKGNKLNWSDFEEFEYIETGFGLYIRRYEINDLFHFSIGGAGPNSEPMYMYLGVNGDDPEARIDIRDGGVTEFIEAHHNDTPASSSVAMVPTDTKMYGLQVGTLLLPIDGDTYRYLLTDNTGEGVTADEQIYAFTEPDLNRTIDWEVYSLKEYPDLSVVMILSKEEGPWLCTYSPPGRCSDTALSDAINAGYVVMEDGVATHGQDIWKSFYEDAQKGEAGSVIVAHYQTLDPERCDTAYFEAFNQDYPSLNLYHLTFDGTSYTLSFTDSGVEYIRNYEYLMKLEASGTPLVGNIEHKRIVHYALTHDIEHTWEELWGSLASSAFPAPIDFYTIYSENVK